MLQTRCYAPLRYMRYALLLFAMPLRHVIDYICHADIFDVC